jgi:hypothetical protein
MLQYISTTSWNCFKISGLILKYLIYSDLIFVWVRDIDLVSVFCSQIFSFHRNFYWRGCFSIIYFGSLCQKSGGHRCGFLSGSSVLLHWCSCLLLCQCYVVLKRWLCSVVWSQGMWHLQCCSICLDYSRSFELPFEFLGLFFNLGD